MQPSISEQTQFYNQYWSRLKPFGSYKVERIIKILEYFNFICKEIKKPEIIDLGCGDGRCVAIWNEFGKACGLDLSDEAMRAAKSRYPFLEFTHGDATSTSFQDKSFDVVVSQEVIEHIENQGQYISECFRLLRDKGFLVLTTPNKYYFDRRQGGNYSMQPIEKTLFAGDLKKLVGERFRIIKMESIVFADAGKGIYRIATNPFLVSVLKKLGIDFIRKEIMNRFQLGVHLCILAQKK